MKITNDKYYTDIRIAKYCIEKTFNIIGRENISKIIEPSAGNGSFSKQIENCLAYDILPEDDSIIKQDFLSLNIEYKKGCLVIGNPPFGERMNMAQKFFKKSVNIADYISFILPITQLNNNCSLYEFDIIYSEDLGLTKFSDREIHCCLNVFKRPISGLNKKPYTKLQDIKIIRESNKNYNNFDFDIRMCYWGNGSAGKILKEHEKYSGEYKIKIFNYELKDKIIEVLSNVKWKEELLCVAMLKINQIDIINILKKYIPQIK